MLNLPPYPQPTGPEWGGMTLNELRMRRTLVQARMQIQKFNIASHVEAMKSRAPLFGGSNSIFSRLTGALSFAEYAFFGLKLFKLVAPLIRRRK